MILNQITKNESFDNCFFKLRVREDFFENTKFKKLTFDFKD